MAFVHSPKIVTDGLVLALDAGNTKSYPGTGTTWFDKSGRENNGTLTNGPTFSSGNGGSIVFDGVDDAATCGNILNGLISYSNEFWFNTSVNILGVEHWIGNQYLATTGRLINDLHSTNRLRNFISGNSIVGDTIIQTNTWYHCVFTRDDSGVGSIYLNGVLDALDSINTVPILDTNYRIANGVLGSRQFTGKIPLNRIYNRQLSSLEVLQNYNATKGRFGL
jgi:hypothetical protein